MLDRQKEAVEAKRLGWWTFLSDDVTSYTALMTNQYLNSIGRKCIQHTDQTCHFLTLCSCASWEVFGRTAVQEW
jgi:hypothetical protein